MPFRKKKKRLFKRWSYFRNLAFIVTLSQHSILHLLKKTLNDFVFIFIVSNTSVM